MKSTAKPELFRELPSVERSRAPAWRSLLAATHGTVPVTGAARAVLTRLREEIIRLADLPALQLALNGLTGAIEERLRHALGHSLRPLINATGVILHTNLGRAPLAEAALAHIRETAGAYSNLEFDLDTGARGRRDVHVDRLFRGLLDDGANFAHLGTAALRQAQGRLSAVLPERARPQRQDLFPPLS